MQQSLTRSERNALCFLYFLFIALVLLFSINSCLLSLCLRACLIFIIYGTCYVYVSFRLLCHKGARMVQQDCPSCLQNKCYRCVPAGTRYHLGYGLCVGTCKSIRTILVCANKCYRYVPAGTRYHLGYGLCVGTCESIRTRVHEYVLRGIRLASTNTQRIPQVVPAGT